MIEREVIDAAVRIATGDVYAKVETHWLFGVKFVERIQRARGATPIPVDPVEMKRVIKLTGSIIGIFNTGGISYELLVPRLRVLDFRLMEAYVGLRALLRFK